MSWFQSSTPAVDRPEHASAAEIMECFRRQRTLLRKLAFLITGDQATADHALATACETTLKRNNPFRDWLLEWAKTATIASAILQNAAAIRDWETAYRRQRCTHLDHLSQADAEERAASLELILAPDAETQILELDPLCRAILVLRIAIRSSIQDCAVRLNVSRAAVLSANCQAMQWLDSYHNQLENHHERVHVAEPRLKSGCESAGPSALRAASRLSHAGQGGPYDDRT